MSIILLTIWSFVFIWCLFLKYLETRKYRSKFPILSIRDISKQFSNVSGDPTISFKLLLNIRHTYKRFVGLRMWPFFNIFLYDPRDVEVILRASREMPKSHLFQKILKPWLGDSILLSSGRKFERNKKIIMKAFHYDRLKQYIPIFEKNANEVVKDLEGFLGFETEFNVYQYISKCMWLTIWETAFGIDNDFLAQDAIPYIQAMERVSQCMAKRALNIRYYPDFFYKFTKTKKIQDQCIEILNSITLRALNRKRKDFENNKIKKSDCKNLNSKKTKLFVDYFFEGISENNEPFSEKEIMDEISTLMLGGHETGTLLICYILCILGNNVQVQERVYEEIMSVLEPGNIKYESLGQLKYLEQVIYETVRLFPSIPIILRRNLQDITLYDGTIIPKHSSIAILIVLLHRNPDEYQNPDEFNPDNFTPEKIKTRHPYSFIPFSAGYRACIGSKYAMLIMKVILVTLLKNFKFGSKTGIDNYQFLPQVGLKRSDGFNISIEKR